MVPAEWTLTLNNTWTADLALCDDGEYAEYTTLASDSKVWKWANFELEILCEPAEEVWDTQKKCGKAEYVSNMHIFYLEPVILDVMRLRYLRHPLHSSHKWHCIHSWDIQTSFHVSSHMDSCK